MGTYLLQTSATGKTQNMNPFEMSTEYHGVSSSSSSSSSVYDENLINENTKFNMQKLKYHNILPQPCSFKIEDILNSSSVFNKRLVSNSTSQPLEKLSPPSNLSSCSSSSSSSSSSISSFNLQHQSLPTPANANEFLLNHAANSLLNSNPFMSIGNGQNFYQNSIENSDMYSLNSYSALIEQIESQKQHNNPYAVSFLKQQSKSMFAGNQYLNATFQRNDDEAPDNNMNSNTNKLLIIDKIAKQIDSFNESNASLSNKKKLSKSKSNKIKAEKLGNNEKSINKDNLNFSCNGNCNDLACCKLNALFR